MLIGIGVFVVGLVAFAILGGLFGMAFEFQFDVGFALTTFVVALIGIYFVGEFIAREFNLI